MYFTHDLRVRYPECFQGDKIMVWAGVVVQVVDGRLGGGLIESKVCVPMESSDVVEPSTNFFF